jgi:hypothetical protein
MHTERSNENLLFLAPLFALQLPHTDFYFILLLADYGSGEFISHD